MLCVLGYSSRLFADNSGLLKPDMGRYDRENKCPLKKDPVHLGSSGIREYAMVIKSHIIRPKNSSSSSNFRGDYRAAVMGTLPNANNPG